MLKKIIISVLPVLALAGCGSTPPIQAQEKTIAYQGQTYVFGGQYDENRNELQLTVNGDPLLKGRFPPYTPTLNLASDYQDVHISSYCYFGSVLSSKGGVFGAVAGAIQSSNSKSGDKCDIKIGGETIESLYF
ncbi:hypothetical protein OIZ54_17325 [Pseudoalteromonas sp. A3]|nr:MULTISPECIES: hypothetical protein [Pseudoalteromonas]HAG41354.1 hypothetical protein [Pseudoalteromonas sp.]ATC82631.1 hypothetical protein PAGA_a2346 [Pseudoalteromonas agarivorans DSM 14585]MCK8094551.1 hypothetical protein [Pseudoalteromonas sp. 1CM17D]MCK8115993.1 hypothetical protein [Pseudoalteromonas sp. 2CM37A]MCK8132190.1 hypothetical protein [Pseudoalteromonas sp. 2CM28B]